MKRTALVIAWLTATATVGATEVGQHPAIFSARSLPGIDASTFITGHPAGGAPGRPAPSELERPAVAKPHAIDRGRGVSHPDPVQQASTRSIASAPRAVLFE